MIWPGRWTSPANESLIVECANRRRRGSAEAAKTPSRAATTAATAAAAAARTAATTTAATAATATAAPSHLLEAGAAMLLVEQMEGRQVGVGDLFFTEQHRLARREIQFLRSVGIRQR